MVNQKGLNEKVADRIGNFVRPDSRFVMARHDPAAVLDMLSAMPEFQVPTSSSASAAAGSAGGSVSAAAAQAAVSAFDELKVLFRYLRALGALPRVHFDLSLARGLDYYTGVIYEAMLTGTDRVGTMRTPAASSLVIVIVFFVFVWLCVGFSTRLFFFDIIVY